MSPLPRPDEPGIKQEIEAKWRLEGPHAHERLRQRLRALGWHREGTAGDRNLLFDREGEMAQRGMVLRVRILDGGPGGVLTVKGPARREGGLRERSEIETAVGDAPALCAALEALGYAIAGEYPKRRETWRLGEAEVALDELPFGLFVEIEAPHAELRRAAEELALDLALAEARGYAALMREHLASG